MTMMRETGAGGVLETKTDIEAGEDLPDAAKRAGSVTIAKQIDTIVATMTATATEVTEVTSVVVSTKVTENMMTERGRGPEGMAKKGK